MATPESALLRARGVEVKFGEQSHQLRYDFDALEKLEIEFDGLDNFVAGLSSWTKRFRTIRRGLEVGLPGIEIADRLNQHPEGMTAYLEAINEALSQSMGVELVDKDDDPKVEGSVDSPGAASTGSPLSVMDGQMPSSGA